MKPQPYWTSRDGRHCLYLGDCLDVLPGMEPGSVDSVVCDPPYGLEFMGKDWDSFKEGDIAMRRNPQMDAVNTGESRQGGRQRACADYQKRQARDMLAFQESMSAVFSEALRVAKPGAHLLAFGGTRTYHRLACAIEDAGWEIRDCIMWVYGSGFPKSLDVSKAIDKAAGAEREVVGKYIHPATGKVHADFRTDSDRSAFGSFEMCEDTRTVTAPATEAARQWSGWGTALKPAWEPIIVARKPLIGNVAANVLRYGTGAVNVDGCRVEHSDEGIVRKTMTRRDDSEKFHMHHDRDAGPCSSGRWPANLIHDGSDEVVGLFPESKDGVAGKRNGAAHVTLHGLGARDAEWGGYGGEGSAARFFYCAKASRADREEGNDHPTVKPTALMRYLCRLVTPPGGKILDPFCGSGSTGKAALAEGFQFVGIERDAKYADIAVRRMERELSQPHLPGLAPHEAGDVQRGLFGE